MAAGYRTHAVTAAIAIGTVLALGGAWTRVWGPEARARRVAEVMSGQPHPDPGAADKVLDLWFAASGGKGPVAQAEWATLEMGRLARSRPASLARAAAGTTPDVRFAFLDVVEDDPAYAALPVKVRLEHAAVHVMRRLDRPGADPLNAAQEEALRADRLEALRVLRNALAAGHCGALAGYDLLAEAPAPAELAAAAEALARAAAQPLHSDLDARTIDHCRERIAERAGAAGERAPGGPAPGGR